MPSASVLSIPPCIKTIRSTARPIFQDLSATSGIGNKKPALMSRLKGWSGSKWTKFVNSGKIGKAPSWQWLWSGIQDFNFLYLF
jgi:hypothetical protein